MWRLLHIGGHFAELYTLLYNREDPDGPGRGARVRDAFGKPQFWINLVDRRNDDGVFGRQLDRGIQEVSGLMHARRPLEGLHLKVPRAQDGPGLCRLKPVVLQHQAERRLPDRIELVGAGADAGEFLTDQRSEGLSELALEKRSLKLSANRHRGDFAFVIDRDRNGQRRSNDEADLA